jgi:hypothetical protein
MVDSIAFTPAQLVRENVRYFGATGCCAGAAHGRFAPAFLDAETGRLLPSRFADGRLAAVHVLDGLPPDLVVERSPAGRVRDVKGGLVSGFLRDGCFYTREEAFRAREAEIEILLQAA